MSLLPLVSSAEENVHPCKLKRLAPRNFLSVSGPVRIIFGKHCQPGPGGPRGRKEEREIERWPCEYWELSR